MIRSTDYFLPILNHAPRILTHQRGFEVQRLASLTRQPKKPPVPTGGFMLRLIQLYLLAQSHHLPKIFGGGNGIFERVLQKPSPQEPAVFPFHWV